MLVISDKITLNPLRIKKCSGIRRFFAIVEFRRTIHQKTKVTRFSIKCFQYCEEHAATSKLFQFLCFLQFVRDEFSENVTSFYRHFITVLCQTDCVGTKRNDTARNRGDCISVVFKSFFAVILRSC